MLHLCPRCFTAIWRRPCPECGAQFRKAVRELERKYNLTYNFDLGVATCNTCQAAFSLYYLDRDWRGLEKMEEWVKHHELSRGACSKLHREAKKGRLSIVGEAGQVSLTDEGALSLED